MPISVEFVPCSSSLPTGNIGIQAVWRFHSVEVSNLWLVEKEMATHSSILAWKIPRTEEPGRLQSCKESDMTE